MVWMEPGLLWASHCRLAKTASGERFVLKPVPRQLAQIDEAEADGFFWFGKRSRKDDSAGRFARPVPLRRKRSLRASSAVTPILQGRQEKNHKRKKSLQPLRRRQRLLKPRSQWQSPRPKLPLQPPRRRSSRQHPQPRNPKTCASLTRMASCQRIARWKRLRNRRKSRQRRPLRPTDPAHFCAIT